MTVDIVYRGLPLSVEGTYTKETPDVWYLRNGDPGYPGDSAEFEIDSVKQGEIEMIDFLDDLYEVRYGARQSQDTYTSVLDEIESLCIEQAAEAEDYPRGEEDI